MSAFGIFPRMKGKAQALIGYCRKHPLLTVMLVAILLRAIAVIFSKGFMASDDQYETVDVAYNWLRTGLWSKEGLLTWGGTVTRDVSRFPLYTLFLYVIMKIYYTLGISSLDTMMYGIRASHAMLSLISVYGVYRIVDLVTRSKDWALIAGLVAAAHLAMPFLSVRNLIEMVGGHFWILSLLLLYRYRYGGNPRELVLAGVAAGVAWMIRFEIAFAVLPVPFLLWYESRRLKEAVVYSSVVLTMLLLSGVVDYYVLGAFADSTVNHIRQVLTESPAYETSVFIYPVVLLAFFLPPLSPVLFYLAGRKRFWRQHRVLFFSSLCFVVAHTLSSSRQERYMIPIIPALIVLLALALWYHWEKKGYFFRRSSFFYSLAGLAVIINLLLLVPLTLNYGHKGVVEPLVRIERMASRPAVMFVTPEGGRIFPFHYGGFELIQRGYIYSWSDLKAFENPLQAGPAYDFFIIYPPSQRDLPRFLDSLSSRFGPLEEAFHIGPSAVDYVLHLLNPKHNKTHEAWVYRPAPGASRACSAVQVAGVRSVIDVLPEDLIHTRGHLGVRKDLVCPGSQGGFHLVGQDVWRIADNWNLFGGSV